MCAPNDPQNEKRQPITEIDGPTVSPGRIPRWEEPGANYFITSPFRIARCAISPALSWRG